MATISQTLTSAVTRRDALLPAGSVMAGHSLEHAYGRAFFVLLPTIYTTLGLSPITAGLIGTVRQVSSGVATMGGGLLIDRLPHRRMLVLYLALMSTGLGYVLVGLAPSYLLILAAVALTGAAGSIWHPAAISLLSQRYPERRGFVVSLHRSSGNLGDTIGPLVVGGLLLVLVWQSILFVAFPLCLALTFMLWRVMRRAASWQALLTNDGPQRPLSGQIQALRELFRGRELVLLLAVSALSGLGQGGFIIWLPLYLQETQAMGSFGIGFHVALLTGIGVVAGPFFGSLSDRVGRKRIILLMITAKAVLALLLAVTGSGIYLTVLIALMGAFMFTVNPLIQAMALDLAHGRQLEGTMIGLLWGNNAVFIGTAPLLVGVLVATLGYGSYFWYVALLNAIGLLAALTLPAATERRTQTVT